MRVDASGSLSVQLRVVQTAIAMVASMAADLVLMWEFLMAAMTVG